MDVVIVGPCGAGKTTLARGLQALGYAARAVAQEHSGIATLWRHGGEPAAVVFLEADPATISARRSNEFPVWLHTEQLRRLADARAHAALTLDTTPLSVAEVRGLVIECLAALGIYGRPDLPGSGAPATSPIQ